MPVLPPSVPKPTASSATVHEFLVQFLLSQDWERTRDEAQEKARKIKVDGKALYELPEKEWTDEFGRNGETIYHALQTSKYGYVSELFQISIKEVILMLIQVQDGGYWPQLEMAGAVFFLMGLLNGGWQLWNEKNLRDYRIPIAFTIVTPLLIISHLFCKSSSVVDSKWFPERLKIRRRTAPTGPWGQVSAFI